MKEDTQNQNLVLPEEIQKAIDENRLFDKLPEIGKNNGLHLDQIGLLEKEVRLVLAGQVHPDEFVDQVEESLGVDTEKAISITADVNMDIFLPVREFLMNSESEKTTNSESVKDHEDVVTKESLLSEIENPAPTIHPISIADQTIPGPAIPKEIVTDLVGSKLSQTTVIPSQKTTTTPNPTETTSPETTSPTQQPEKPKTYTADPYREPLL